MAQFLRGKTVACSVYRKILKYFERRRLWKWYCSLEAGVYKRCLFKNFLKLIGKNLYRNLYLMKLLASSLQLNLKRDLVIDTHQPTDQRLIDPQTQWSYLRNLAMEKFSFHKTLMQLRKLFGFIMYLMNNIFPHNFEYQQKKTWLPINCVRRN